MSWEYGTLATEVYDLDKPIGRDSLPSANLPGRDSPGTARSLSS